jgi:hypothetical protein
MGTTDNFDSPAYSGPVAAADTIPVISASTARAATARVDQMLRGGYGTPVSVNTAGANTLTAANVLAGVYVRDCNGAGRIDTLPTAALLVAAMTRPAIGDIIRLLVVNGTTGGATTLTLAAGVGGTFDANQTAASQVVGPNSSKLIHIRLTNVTASSEAYVVYC